MVVKINDIIYGWSTHNIHMGRGVPFDFLINCTHNNNNIIVTETHKWTLVIS